VKARTLSLDSRVTAAPSQVSCDLGGEAVILNTDKGVYYGLNPVGSRIWSLVQEPTTLRETRDVILREYDVEPALCEADMLALIQTLADEGLVQVIDGDSP
jgi:hypothetical protein